MIAKVAFLRAPAETEILANRGISVQLESKFKFTLNTGALFRNGGKLKCSVIDNTTTLKNSRTQNLCVKFDVYYNAELSILSCFLGSNHALTLFLLPIDFLPLKAISEPLEWFPK